MHLRQEVGGVSEKSGVQSPVCKAAVPESTVGDLLRARVRGKGAQNTMGGMALERSDGHREET